MNCGFPMLTCCAEKRYAKKREGGGKSTQLFPPPHTKFTFKYFLDRMLLQMHAAVDGNVFAGDVAPGF
ncbi:MAG: hypothetical protein BWX73_03378 [Lentisphaerae bacterium ADurb.Bin082]|nr:MAG: hypothetical protein BWX73_03378 [Lentisphaerae bacterium ADurb.Bin082]